MELDQICNIVVMSVAVLAVVMVWIVDINGSSERSRDRFKEEIGKK